jgi:hypothetical protein
MDTIIRGDAQATEAPTGPAWQEKEQDQADELLDDDDQDDTPPVLAAPPVPDDPTWSPFDPRGTDECVRVRTLGQLVIVEAGFSRRCPAPASKFDTGAADVRERALAAARRLEPVGKWAAARRGLAEQERAARLARLAAEAAAMRREQLLADGTDPDLAAQLKRLAEERDAAVARAEAAEELAAHAREAEAARRKEAAEAVGQEHRRTMGGALQVAKLEVQEAVRRLAEVAGPELDAVVRALMRRQTIGLLSIQDRAGLERQLLARLEADVELAAARGTPLPPA